MTRRWAVIRVADSDDDADAFGPFTSYDMALAFRNDVEEWVAPGYGYAVVELTPVREGLAQIKVEKANESEM